MVILYIILAALMFSLQNLIFKKISSSKNTTFLALLSFYLLFFSITTVIMALDFHLSNDTLTTTSIICGILFGLSLTTMLLSFSKSLSLGPVTLSTLIFSLGMIVPIIFSFFYYKEKLSILQIIGFLFLLLTFYLVNKTSNSNDSVSLKWFGFAILAFLGNGSLMTTIKIHQNLESQSNITTLPFIGFFTATIIVLVTILIKKMKIGKFLFNSSNNNSFLITIFYALLCAITSLFGNRFNISLASMTTSVIQFPSVNGANLCMTSCFAYIFFKERLNKYQIFGIIIGIIAMILINI